MREIPLSRGLTALVDDADFEALSVHKWFAVPSSNGKGFYAARNVRQPDGTNKRVWMHRMIMAAPDGMPVDHASGEGLDNRRHNLRLATVRQNNFNRRTTPAGPYRGVKRLKVGYAAQLNDEGGRVVLGRYSTALQAAKAYDQAARACRGEFALLNFPTELAAPLVGDAMTLAETAALANLSADRFQKVWRKYVELLGFPKPARAQVGRSYLWSRSAVEEWSTARSHLNAAKIRRGGRLEQPNRPRGAKSSPI